MTDEKPSEEDLRSAYRLLLGREPDPEGFRHWQARLADLTVGALVRQFMDSTEFRHRQAARPGEAMDFAKPSSPPPNITPLVSQLVTQAQIDSATYWRWCEELAEPVRYHRKQWEHVYVLQALAEAGLLQPTSRGLGFGVGREPVPSILAKRGCQLIVTDLDATSAAAQDWRETSQHAASLDDLHMPEICDRETFRRNVQFRAQDMNAIDDELKSGGFDFVWSLCALEHLGSLRHGMEFVQQSLRCLRPGGVAVHTTEYNLSSNDDTIKVGGTVLYRRRDIEAMANRLRRRGFQVHLNLHPGDGELDRHYDVPPYREAVHLKLRLDQYIVTSLGLIIRKPARIWPFGTRRVGLFRPTRA